LESRVKVAMNINSETKDINEPLAADRHI